MSKINGLAVYKKGEGDPLLLMPYPHASAYHSMADSPLVDIFTGIGFSVITFDPPGIFNSVRTAKVTLQEMLDCTSEVLDYFKINGSIPIVGHSQSGFCALAYAIENPGRVEKMVLIGTTSGWPMVKRASIHKQIEWSKREKWQMMYWGTRKMLGLSNLRIHKNLDQLVIDMSYVNKDYISTIPIFEEDKRKSEPIRAQWMVNLRQYNYDYSNRLYELSIPTLICVGKYDPQTPVLMSEELRAEIKGSKMIIFEHSGHSPFIEEKELFISTIQNWKDLNDQ